MDFTGGPLGELSPSVRTLTELEELAQMVGRSTALAKIRANQGNTNKSEIWSAEAKIYAERAQPITSLYPDTKLYYENIVTSVIDSYFELT